MEAISVPPHATASSENLLHSPTAAVAPPPQPSTSATKRKRPSPILTALPAPNIALPADDPHLLLASRSPLKETTSEPMHASPHPEKQGTRAATRSTKLLRVSDTNGDVSSGSPNVSAETEGGERYSEAIKHHPQIHHHALHHPGVTPRSSPPEFHLPVHSPTPSPPAPLLLSSSSHHPSAAPSAQHSTASSAYSTPLWREGETGFTSVSRGTAGKGHFQTPAGGTSVGESPSWSASMDDTEMHAAPSGANTPPSNVASPSATPRLCPTANEDRRGGMMLGEQDEPRQFPLSAITAVSIPTFLPSSRASPAGRAISPSSSPAHSPTSTASHLRPAYDCPPLHLNTCSPLTQPAASPQLAAIPSAMATSTPRYAGSTGQISPRSSPTRSRNHSQHTSHPTPPRAPSSGSASVASAVSEPGGSPKALHPRPRLLLNLPSSGNSPTHSYSSSVGRGPSPAASPARSPLPAGSWTKPHFLSRLSVVVPELSPGIGSPVAAFAGATGGTPVARPSPSQAARDRSALLLNSGAILTKPLPVPDGIVEEGENYAVSMKKGRRRNMEDYWMTGTIEFDATHAQEAKGEQTLDGAGEINIPSAINLVEHVDSVLEMDASHDSNNAAIAHSLSALPLSSSSINFYGICDGHGKNGSLVAQLTASLLPSLLQEQLCRDEEELMEEARKEETERKEAPPAGPTNSADDGFVLSPALHSTRTSTTMMSTSSLTAGATPSSSRMSDIPLHSPPPRMTLPPVHQATKRSILSVLSPTTGGNEIAMAGVQDGGMTVAASRISPKSSPRASSTTATPIDGADGHLDGIETSLPAKPSDCIATLVTPCDSPSDFISAALQAAHMELDQRVLRGKYTGGTTCVTVLLHHDNKVAEENSNSTVSSSSSPCTTLYISNVGDSRAVLSRNSLAYSLTSDHKPDGLRKDERERVERAGGRVVWVSGWRVDGVLNISRAIGDAHLKDPLHPHLGRIVARPEISLLRVTEEDEFVILASDGVWGRVENQKAVEIVRKVLLGVDESEGRASMKSPVDEPEECKAASVIREGDEADTEGDARMELPRHPSLTHEHSYVDASPDASSALGGRPNPLNPIVASAEEGSAVPSYDRVPSSETILSAHTPRRLMMSSGGLRTDGTMSTTVSQRTNITAVSAADASMNSRLQSPLVSPDASTRTYTSRISSTQLTTPIGAMQMSSPAVAHLASHFSTSKPRAPAATDPSSSSSVSLSSRGALDPSRLGLATEALLQYAYEEANSMDNMSVCIVLLNAGR